MANKIQRTTSVDKVTKTKGGYFSGARLAQNVRSFMNGIKKA